MNSILSIISLSRLIHIACFFWLCGIAQAAPLVEIKNCTLIKTDWADGDSFLVQIPEKPADANGPGHKAREISVRLYGVDCIESVVKDAADLARLGEQRRYFGITGFGGNPQASMKLATEFGAEATKETIKLLEKPFTIYTSFADGRGDPKFERVYAFVYTADGEDLSSLLVSKGLARAHGVCRETPNKLHRDDYRAALADLELQAAKNGKGIWQHTDWDLLPKERQDQRNEERQVALALANLKPALPEVKIHINSAAKNDLILLPGIGDVMADRIIENRPYRVPEDLLEVNGIGKKTLEKLLPHLEFPAE